MAAVATILGATAAQAAEWDYSEQGRGMLEFLNNPLLAPKTASNYASDTADANGTLSADVVRHGDQLDLKIDPSVSFYRFVNHSVFNRDDEYLNTLTTYKTQLANWSLLANGTRDTTITSELGTTGLTNTNARHEYLNVTAGPTVQLTERFAVVAQAGWQAAHYPDMVALGLLDYRYTTGDLREIYSLTERTQVSFDTSVSQLSTAEIGGRPTTYSAEGIVSTQLSELWTTSLAAGPVYVSSDTGGANGAVYEFDLQRTGEVVTLTSKVSRSVLPTGRGILTRYDQVQLGAIRQLSERLTWNVNGQYTRNSNLTEISIPTASGLVVHYFSLESDLQWKFATYWSFSASIQGQRQYLSYTGVGQGANAGNYRFNLGIVWNGDPHWLH